MTSQKTNKTMFGIRRGVSPILATVLLLGITVVGGGLAYSLMAQGANTAASQNIITLENAQAVKGTGHADLTATIKNGGSIPWKTVEMTVAKGELGEPILYEALHENVRGCTDATDGCYASSPGLLAGVNLDNPLRVQWIASLDITGGTKDVADRGEGISAGRKFVISTNDPSVRTVLIPNGTSVYKQMKNSPTTERTSSNINAITPSVWCSPTSADETNCSAYFNALDAGTIKSGEFAFCKEVTNGMECKVLSHRKISTPIQPGQSVQIYADVFTKAVPGLNNIAVQNGDGLVVNVVSEGENGSTARYQTVIKVVGI